MNTFYDPRLVKGGEAVAFGVAIGDGVLLPVEISREALEDHFDTPPQEGRDLVGAYVRNRDEIDARAKMKRISSVLYTTTEPLILSTADF